jgi:cytochrome c-type biogenesis protein CcmH
MSVVSAALLGLTALGSAPVSSASTGPAIDLGPPRGIPLSGPALDARTEEVGGLLRCPVCQGLSVADSPATMARNMKAEVREKLAAGYDDEQILQHFERSYGEFVRLQPPLRGVNWLVWFGPFAALVAGGAAVALALKRSTRRAALGQHVTPATAADLPARDTVPDDPRLAAAVREVRKLAYGWADGVPPRPPVSTS